MVVGVVETISMKEVVVGFGLLMVVVRIVDLRETFGHKKVM